jgi:hypothetical protein
MVFEQRGHSGSVNSYCARSEGFEKTGFELAFRTIAGLLMATGLRITLDPASNRAGKA